MGDFDAKTGRNYERWEGILGPRGIGKKMKIEKIEKDCFSSAKQILLHHKQSKKDNHNPNLQERRQGNM